MLHDQIAKMSIKIESEFLSTRWWYFRKRITNTEDA